MVWFYEKIQRKFGILTNPRQKKPSFWGDYEGILRCAEICKVGKSLFSVTRYFHGEMRLCVCVIIAI